MRWRSTGGIVSVKGREGGPTISLGEIATRLKPTSRHRGGRTPGLSADGWFDTAHQTYPYGVQIAQVRIDAETCGLTIERLLAAYDIGRAINPKMVEGQITGGFAQGLGGALYEEFIYDSRGQPLALSLADYIMPTAMEMPRHRHPAHRGCAEHAEPARHQGGGRKRDLAGWRAACFCDRRRAGHARCGHGVACDTRAPEKADREAASARCLPRNCRR